MINDNELEILYHALGKDVVEGIKRFDRHFRLAEVYYELADINALLNLLTDPTLYDEELKIWHHYYLARKALLQWQIADFEAQIRIFTNAKSDEALLQQRLALLKGQLYLIQGKWILAREWMRDALGFTNGQNEPLLVAETQEWIAQAYISEITSIGGWDVKGEVHLIIRQLLTFALLPLYFVLWIYLRSSDIGEFWTCAHRYGGKFVNWPIFRFYVRAYLAIRTARSSTIAAKHKGEAPKLLQISLMEADIKRQILLQKEANAIYSELLEKKGLIHGSYQEALIKHKLAESLLEQSDSIKATSLLKEAQSIYERFNDDHANAQIDLLLGDAYIQERRYVDALEKYNTAMQFFSQPPIEPAIAKVLSRYYTIVEDELGIYSETTKRVAKAEIDQADQQVFVLRVPNRLFNWMQMIAWLLPLIALILVGLIFSNFIISSSRIEMTTAASALFSLRSLELFLLVILATMALSIGAGMIGLVATLRTKVSSLDYVAADKTGIFYYGTDVGVQKQILWSSVDSFVRIERSFWLKPTKLLSYDYIQSIDGTVIELPYTISWYPHLQRLIEKHIHRKPDLLRARWFAGLPLLFGLIAVGLTIVLISQDIPSLGYHTQANMSIIVTVLTYLMMFYYIGSLISHYIDVYSLKLPQRTFRIIVMFFAVALLLVGTVGRYVVFMLGPIFIFAGSIALYKLIYGFSANTSTTQAWIFKALSFLVAVVGLLVLIRAILPTLLNMQTYTIATAGRNAFIADSCEPTELDPMFEEMRSTATAMTKIDPGYLYGYGYLGIANYYFCNYEESARNFDLAVEFREVARAAPDYHYCRALAYRRLNNEIETQKSCSIFKSLNASDDHVCGALFAEEGDVCEQTR